MEPVPSVQRVLMAELGRACAGLDPWVGGLDVALATILERNRALWQLEDAVREADRADDVARLTRAIHEANLARHEAVDAFDARLSAAAATSDPSTAALVNSESFGEMIDRAAILALKQAALARSGSDEELEHVRRRWDHLLVCLARCVEAARAGTLYLAPRREVKVYEREGRREPLPV